ncbi:hypothetical protein SDC9_208658 [bioreactor metagenome]|uniref:Uncharacterized protein n=1 Tax=bioreactor metagenome TaxID=1076179 RepID=A0A645JB65_9ZZZZ
MESLFSKSTLSEPISNANALLIGIEINSITVTKQDTIFFLNVFPI